MGSSGTSWPNGFRQGHPVGGEVQDPLQEGPQDRERVRQASREAVPFPGAPDGCQVQCRCVETPVHVAVQPPAHVDLQDRQGDEGEDRSGGGLGDQRRAHARRRGAQADRLLPARHGQRARASRPRVVNSSRSTSWLCAHPPAPTACSSAARSRRARCTSTSARPLAHPGPARSPTCASTTSTRAASSSRRVARGSRVVSASKFSVFWYFFAKNTSGVFTQKKKKKKKKKRGVFKKKKKKKKKKS